MGILFTELRSGLFKNLRGTLSIDLGKSYNRSLPEAQRDRYNVRCRLDRFKENKVTFTYFVKKQTEEKTGSI